MLPPFLQNGGRVKHSGKKSVGEGQKILILKKGLCYGEGGGGVDYSSGRVQIIIVTV